ncbi:UDP-N-acetylmuramoyl-L-alanine--D-glutamate ligase [Colwelliaceae bacterium BS250]
MTQLEFLQGKKILVLGLGATGLSCARFLTSQGLIFSVNDSRNNPPGSNRLADLNPAAQLITGYWDSEAIANADVIIASPGVDINIDAIASHRQQDSALIGDVELYCQLLNQQAEQGNKTTNVIAVTGSNGKSTVVSLLAHMSDVCGIKSVLAGNIGVPVLDVVNQADDTVILELSSFQLETMSSMRAIAATVLNISDDHLDRHKTLANYQNIKHKIYDQAQVQVLNRQQQISQPRTINNNAISFGLDQPETGHFGIRVENARRYLCFGEQQLLACEHLPLVGLHNELNCLAALALGYAANWPLTAMTNALKSFEGLEHRCKQVTSNDGIIWVNDSKATNIGATIAAIKGLATHDKNLTLIAGGDGKGADFSELAPVLTKYVTQLITLGKDGPQIAQLLSNSLEVNTLTEAVAKAREIAKPSDIVLLSPACASIDMFENYMQRGEQFITAVRESY